MVLLADEGPSGALLACRQGADEPLLAWLAHGARMSSRLLPRRANGRFRSMPSLEEMGVPISKTPRTCNACGTTWNPLVVYGVCPKCGISDSREAEKEES